MSSRRSETRSPRSCERGAARAGRHQGASLRRACARRLVRGVPLGRARREAARRHRAGHSARAVPRRGRAARRRARPLPAPQLSALAGPRAGVGASSSAATTAGSSTAVARCSAVPGLVGEPAGAAARRVPAFAAREAQGFVWVWGRADAEPTGEPFRVPLPRRPRATSRCSAPSTSSARCTPRSRTRSTCRTPPSSTAAASAAAPGASSRRCAAGCPAAASRCEYLGERRRPGDAKPRLDGRRSSTGTASSCRASRRWSTGMANART